MNENTFKTPWGKEIRAFCREKTIDWDTLQSCIVEDEYQIGRLPDKGLAIDLGAYIGGATLALLSRGWDVISVEPLPENVELLKRNLDLNNINAEIFLGAVGKEGEQVIRYQNPDTEYGKAHQFIGSAFDGGDGIKAKSVSLQNLFKLYDIKKCDFLKIDIEGGEWDLDFTGLGIDRIAVEIEGMNKITSTQEYAKLLPEFKDVSKEYFPKWCHPSKLVHGYFIK